MLIQYSAPPLKRTNLSRTPRLNRTVSVTVPSPLTAFELLISNFLIDCEISCWAWLRDGSPALTETRSELSHWIEDDADVFALCGWHGMLRCLMERSHNHFRVPYGGSLRRCTLFDRSRNWSSGSPTFPEPYFIHFSRFRGNSVSSTSSSSISV